MSTREPRPDADPSAGHYRNGRGGHNRIPELKLPPQNLEAERGVLGGILRDNATLPGVVSTLRPEDFYRDSHQILYRAIRDLSDRGGPVDVLLLAEELKTRGELEKVGGDPALSDLLEGVPHAANTPYYAQIVREKAIARAVVEACEEAIRDAYAEQTTASELAARLAERLDTAGVLPTRPPAAEPRAWPEPPEAAAYHGLAGDVVGLIAPHTEADPAAILVQLLVGLGSVAGRNPHWRVEATRHHLNLFACVVGNSSKARKGTSWDQVRRILGGCDPAWEMDGIVDGLSSGEGLIWAVRDPVYKDGEQVVAGVADKRLLVVETEFGATLNVLGREGNTLSAVIRKAWDSGHLRSLTKNSPARATGAHVSIIGHVTGEELDRRLSHTDAANGFANRFLWCCARRSRYLPHGGRVHQVDFADVFRRLSEAVAWAGEEEVCFVRDAEANLLWERAYPALSDPRPGLLGAVASRAEAQVMRLACLYALLDRSPFVHVAHLEAGLALWRYCERSVATIFGDSLGDPDAERLLAALCEAGEGGLTRTQITAGVFQRHRSAEEVAAALGKLLRAGLIERATAPTAGRPVEVWRAVEGHPAKEAKEAKEGGEP